MIICVIYRIICTISSFTDQIHRQTVEINAFLLSFTPPPSRQLFFVEGLCCFSEDDERKVRFQNGHKRPLNVTDAAPKETKMFYNKESKKRRIYRRDN